MFCTKCGRENAEGATQCAHCQAPLVEVGPAPLPGRTSGMAVASLVLGISGFFLLAIPSLLGLVLGIVSLVRINRSGGKLRGRGMAVAGICVSGVAVLMLPIMAAMLFPVFARARESARKVQCLSNMKNVSTALQMYAMDYDAFPMAERWSDLLTEHVRDAEAYRCPSEPALVCGYAFNAELAGTGVFGSSDPVTTIAFFESDVGWNAAGGWDLLAAMPRHLGGDNYGYADGHCAWQPRGASP